MPNIATLTVTLAADSAKYVAELAKADRHSKTFVGSVQKAVKVGAAAVATSAAAGAAALTALTAQQLEAIDALAKTADRLNVSTEKLAAYNVAARLSGVGTEQFEKGQVRLAKAINDATNGLTTYTRAFGILGLDPEELKRMAPFEQFEAVGRALNSVENQTERLSAAYDIFGGRNVALINLMMDMAGGLEQLEADTKAWGVAISRVDAKKVENANDAFELTKIAMEGIGNTIAVTVAPLIEAVSTGFVDAATESDGFKSEIEAAMRAVVVSTNFAANAIRGVQLSLLQVKIAALQVQQLAAESSPTRNIINRSLLLLNATSLPGTNLKPVRENQLDKIRADLDAAIAKSIELANSFTSSEQALAAYDRLVTEANERARKQVAEAAVTLPTGGGDGDVVTGLSDDEREQLEGRLQAVRESLFTETDAVREAFKERLLIIAEAHAEHILSDEEHHKILIGLAEQHADELARIEEEKQERINRAVLNGIQTREEFEKASLKTQAKGVLGTLERITSGVAVHNKTLFRLNQAAAIANAVINTAEGVTKALSAYPPPLSFAMAAAQAAAGAVQIAAIRSAQFGGGTTPSVAGSVPTLEGQPVQQPKPLEDQRAERVATINLYGDILTEDRLERVLTDMFDADRVIINRNTSQAAEIRMGS